MLSGYACENVFDEYDNTGEKHYTCIRVGWFGNLLFYSNIIFSNVWWKQIDFLKSFFLK